MLVIIAVFFAAGLVWMALEAWVAPETCSRCERIISMCRCGKHVPLLAAIFLSAVVVFPE